MHGNQGCGCDGIWKKRGAIKDTGQRKMGSIHKTGHTHTNTHPHPHPLGYELRDKGKVQSCREQGKGTRQTTEHS